MGRGFPQMSEKENFLRDFFYSFDTPRARSNQLQFLDFLDRKVDHEIAYIKNSRKLEEYKK